MRVKARGQPAFRLTGTTRRSNRNRGCAIGEIPPGHTTGGETHVQATRWIAWVVAGVLAAAPLMIGLWQWVPRASADDFELAMVIKETTNPYYNATLKGAQIAASEIGGHRQELRPDTIERPGAGRHHQQPRRSPRPCDRGRAERSRCRRPCDETGAEARRQGHDVQRRLGRRGRPFFVNQATSDSIGRFGAILLVKAMGENPKGQVAIVSAQPTAANQNAWIEAFKDEMQIQGHRDRRYGLWLRQRAEGLRRYRRADDQVS